MTSSRADQIAIVGVGNTSQGELPGLSVEEIAVQAVTSALSDAGLDKGDLDGLIACKSPEGAGNDVSVGAHLGLNIRFSQSLDYGTSNFSLHLATMAITSGMAETIVLCYATTSRSRRYRFGQKEKGSTDIATMSGLVHIAGPAGLALQRHKHLYGTTDEQFGWIAVAQREWARKNPLAIFRKPLTMSEYLEMPYLVEPLRRPDITMVSDGGVALIVTTADRARDLPQRPVYLQAISEHANLRGGYNEYNLTRPWIRDAADEIWQRSGYKPSDIDLLYIQDPTAMWVLQMLEYCGFCGIGEGGLFLAEGHTRPGGRLPINTNGGQLSESYAWGWLHICEAVRQLRGAAGDRQVADARTAMYCTAQSFYKTAMSIFSNTPESP